MDSNKDQLKKHCAVINGTRVECYKCGSMLMLKTIENNPPARIGEIKCNHRRNGDRCGAMNEIVL